MSDILYSLAGFQREGVNALTGAIGWVAKQIESQPERRREVALRNGGMLLEAPTGSGKTLILGRTLEATVGALRTNTVWFWFAPFAGLVTQTREALAAQCPRLRLRDLTVDRTATGSRDGDVFVATWGLVATNNVNARRVRSGNESVATLDAMLEALRADGFAIGAVIDEAHLNFGSSARVAADFYLQVLQPDFTLLATATPNDDKLEAFEKEAGVSTPTRVTIARGDVVAAGLNKQGLTMGLLRFKPEDAALIDPEQAVLIAGWKKHLAIVERLKERSIGLTPLMLVQVEDQAAGGADPVKRVKELLIASGVPEATIATHTSGQPDPDFHTLAYDPDKQVLIFKVAVATGFDAPRAWTLVSVRPNRGVDFGLQVVGRIMRVHPLVRPIHGQDPLLDRGYVFLTDPEIQAGLDAAAEALKAVRTGIEVVTDRLEIEEMGTAAPLTYSGLHRAFRVEPAAPMSEVERQTRLTLLIEKKLVPATTADRTVAEQDRAIVVGEQLIGGSLFENFPEQQVPAKPKTYRGYPLKRELGLPGALWRERPLLPHELDSDEFLTDVARSFCADQRLLLRIGQTQRQAIVSLRDLFLSVTGEEGVSVRLSDARVAEQAQQAFQFNDSIDVRKLKIALVKELRRVATANGMDADERDFRRAIDLEAMLNPEGLKAAVKEAQARRITCTNDEELPPAIEDISDLPEARKSAYGVFPARMTSPERRVAELLDTDESGVVQWWLRNVENTVWATRIILPNGKSFFPDFVVGVNGRRSEDQIGLIEVKDDGVDGRLHSDLNLIKIRTRHQLYRDVKWTAEGDAGMEWLRLNEGLNRIQPDRPFSVNDLIQ